MGPFPYLRLYLLHTSSYPFFGSACRVTNSENGKPFFSEAEVFLALLFREAFFQLSFFIWESVARVQQFAIGEGGWQGKQKCLLTAKREAWLAFSGRTTASEQGYPPNTPEEEEERGKHANPGKKKISPIS